MPISERNFFDYTTVISEGISVQPAPKINSESTVTSNSSRQVRGQDTDYRMATREISPILEVQDLSVSFVHYTRGLRQELLTVITNLNLELYPGQVTAIVGSSGSGKSLLAHAILGLLPRNARLSGSMLFEGQELTPRRQKNLRGKELAFIPQSVSFLDPLMKVGNQVGLSVPNGYRKGIQEDVFRRYNLEKSVESMYPFQLSGGMARRVLVAGAVVTDARVVIADEPTPGLHPQAVAEAMAHLRQLANEGRTIMLITHDVEAGLQVADRIAVFYAGTTVESAPVEDFTGNGQTLRHPYSQALWKSLPRNGFSPYPGYQPPPGELPPGCLFAPRCSLATEACTRERPGFRNLRGGKVRCLHAS